jgi:hypothetical protein
MAIRNLLHKNLPSAELNERARETRVRLERLERLLLPRVEAPGLWRRPFARFVNFRLNDNGRRGGQTGGSMSDSRRDCMPETNSVSADGIIQSSQATEATKSPVGAAAQRGSAGCGYMDHRCRSGRARPTRQHEPRTYLAFECRQLRQRSMVRTANLNPQRHPEKTHHKLL